MKTQLLTAAIATTLIITGTQTSQASDLSLTFAALKSARRTNTPTTQTRPQVNTAAAPKLLLGAYLTDTESGLQVSGTAPASPASKALKKGDVLRRIAVLNQPTRTLNTLNQFEYAKRAIGPNRQAVLEVYRPGQGITYVWVTFRPAGELANFSQNVQQANARSMFHASTDNLVSQ